MDSQFVIENRRRAAQLGFRQVEFREARVEAVSGQWDLTVCMSLIHHLVGTANFRTLDATVAHLAGLTGRALIVEYIPTTDRFSQRVFAGKAREVLASYSERSLLNALRRSFTWVESVGASAQRGRTIYAAGK